MSARRHPTWLLLAGAAALAGCASCESLPEGALTQCEGSRVVPAAVKTDILFVIDDSGSMSEEQANLRDNLGAFITALASAPIANEFQIGVTNSAVEGATGGQAYTAGPSAGVPFPDGALVAIDRDATGTPLAGNLNFSAGTFGGTRILTAGSTTLVDDFRANVLVGTNGPGKEQSFRAARLALSDRLADANAGFLRPGARLAIVFVSDEDDCSDSSDPLVTDADACHADTTKATQLDTIEDFAAFLRGDIGGESRDVLVAAIVGVDPATLEPSCGTCSGCGPCTNHGCGTAFDKGDRFVDLVGDLGPTRTRLGSICDASFDAILQDIAGLIVAQTVPLEGTPADWRMLVAGVERAGATIPCTVALDGTPEAAPGASDAVYSPPREGSPATLTFQGNCRVQQGDRIQLDVVCAG